MKSFFYTGQHNHKYLLANNPAGIDSFTNIVIFQNMKQVVMRLFLIIALFQHMHMIIILNQILPDVLGYTSTSYSACS